jgi:hypothetical protein
MLGGEIQMNAEEFFEFADEIDNIIFKNCDKQIIFRSIINRLYYGVFHYVQKKFGAKYYHNGTCHQEILKEGLSYGYHDDFFDLMQLRKKSDYILDQTIRKDDVSQAQDLKNEIIQLNFHVPYDYEENDRNDYRVRKKKSL